MIGKLAVRIIGATALGLVGFGVGMSVADAIDNAPDRMWIVLGSSLSGVLIGFVFTPYTLVPLFRFIIRHVSETPIRLLVAGTAGLTIGLIISILVLLAFPVTDLPTPWDVIVPVFISMTVAFLALMAVVVRERELSQLIGLHRERPTSESSSPDQSSERNGPVILMDTSAIIDGRIADITKTGFVDGRLIIPNFVLDELQYIADSADPLRRGKGRRGLEVLDRLRKDSHIQADIEAIDVHRDDGVDSKLVSIAKASNYCILTTDFNLNKVAELQGVRVLNINELANSLKPVTLPGEELTIHITQEGKEEGQGVGFMDDGTMVVVEGGKKHLNSQLPIVITRVLQTSAGRIIFAHLK